MHHPCGSPTQHFLVGAETNGRTMADRQSVADRTEILGAPADRDRFEVDVPRRDARVTPDSVDVGAPERRAENAPSVSVGRVGGA